MEKINTPRTSKLTNEQWLEFKTEKIDLTNEYDPAQLGIVADFAISCNLYDKACIAIKIIRESIYTLQIEKADKIRDYDYNELRKKIKDYLKHYDPDTKDAAIKLNIVIKRYGNVAQEEYNDESASIMLFVKEVRDNFMGEVNALGINDLLHTLEQHNDEFRILMNQREQEYFQKTQLKMTVAEIRKAHDACDRDIADRINAMNLLNPSPIISEYIEKLNLKIEHYNRIVAIKEGKNKAKGEAGEIGEAVETGEVNVTSVTLNPSALNLNSGDTAILTAIILPDAASNKTVTWTSSDPSVATVSMSGMVTAISTGTTIITVTAIDGGITDNCNITVN